MKVNVTNGTELLKSLDTPIMIGHLSIACSGLLLHEVYVATHADLGLQFLLVLVVFVGVVVDHAHAVLVAGRLRLLRVLLLELAVVPVKAYVSEIRQAVSYSQAI